MNDDRAVQRQELIGANLRALRLKHGITLDDAARAAGLSLSHLANVESGRRCIGGEQLRRVLNLYGYSLAVFLSHIESFVVNDGREHYEQTTESHEPIPLVGRSESGARLLLLEPVLSVDRPAYMLLILPPGSELWQPHIVLPCCCRVGVARGELLIETPQREYVLAESQYLSIAASVPHRFRNHTTSESRAYIWSETACV